jgi:hypothetical protein
MKMIYLKFKDHSSEANESWESIESIEPTAPEIEVIGFVAKETDDTYTLVQAHGDGEFRNVFHVLKSTIVKKRIFKNQCQKKTK